MRAYDEVNRRGSITREAYCPIWKFSYGIQRTRALDRTVHNPVAQCAGCTPLRVYHIMLWPVFAVAVGAGPGSRQQQV